MRIDRHVERCGCLLFRRARRLRPPYRFVLAQTEGAELPPSPVPTWDPDPAMSALGVTAIPFETPTGVQRAADQAIALLERSQASSDRDISETRIAANAIRNGKNTLGIGGGGSRAGLGEAEGRSRPA